MVLAVGQGPSGPRGVTPRSGVTRNKEKDVPTLNSMDDDVTGRKHGGHGAAEARSFYYRISLWLCGSAFSVFYMPCLISQPFSVPSVPLW